MGFGLWIDRDQAWAEGTSEYRAMGAAVISVTEAGDRVHARIEDVGTTGAR